MLYSVKEVGEIYWSGKMGGWVVDLTRTGESLWIFPSQEEAMAWAGDRLR